MNDLQQPLSAPQRDYLCIYTADDPSAESMFFRSKYGETIRSRTISELVERKLVARNCNGVRLTNRGRKRAAQTRGGSAYDLSCSPLKEGSGDVATAEGLSVGDRVCATSSLVSRWELAGISSEAIEAAKTGGVVVRIVRSTMGWWTTVVVRLDAPAIFEDGSGGDPHHGFGPEDLVIA